jgi:hypothetical protein
VAAAIVPGFGVSGLPAAFVLTIGLAGLNALFSAMMTASRVRRSGYSTVDVEP